nr:mitochondrial peptide methionine sulfoxide reductase [Marmota flaviventris]
MLRATRRACQLLHSLLPVPRMSASKLVGPQEALPGRGEAMPVAAKHHVNGNRTVEPFPEGTQMAVFGMGCFWGAERKFWILKGVYSTQVGFAGGYTPNPTYKEVCSGDDRCQSLHGTVGVQIGGPEPRSQGSSWPGTLLMGVHSPAGLGERVCEQKHEVS